MQRRFPPSFASDVASARPRRRQAHRTVVLAVGALVVGLLVVSQVLSQSDPAGTATPTARTRPPAPAGSVMDNPIRILAETKRTFQGVKDYTCTLIKQERLRGQMQPQNIISMKVRNQPFSVYLRWISPQAMAGQEACYVAGKNDSKMRVHLAGWRGAIGWISLDPKDPRALENSKHSITDAGIGNLINRFDQRWHLEQGWNKTQVRIADYEYNKRKCTRIETVHPDNSGKQFYSYRSVIYIDKETHLPVRIETYDWPKPGGNANGDMMESYSYINMRVNVGLGDESFNY